MATVEDESIFVGAAGQQGGAGGQIQRRDPAQIANPRPTCLDLAVLQAEAGECDGLAFKMIVVVRGGIKLRFDQSQIGHMGIVTGIGPQDQGAACQISHGGSSPDIAACGGIGG